MNADRTLILLTNTRKELDELEVNLRKATDVQWERSPTSQTGAAERRGRGGHTDPTGDTATDPKRLSVRRAVVETDNDLQKVYRCLRAANGKVRHATGRWEG
jgi:hypothetical protein